MASSEIHSQSRFGSLFKKKLEDNADHKVANAFDSELSALGTHSRPKLKLNEGLSLNGRQKNGSRKRSFQSSFGWKDRGISSDSFYSKGQSASKHFSNGVLGRKEESRVPPSYGLRHRKRETVVVLDDDDEVLETLDCIDETRDECMKDAKIYYPSRDDPECVEICFQDIDCLAPESFLTSPIMNFYIRYLELQASPSQKATCDYHIFNTFFYKKLQQELSRKESEKESLFVKFRRWWKGVNLFEKAYVLIPIHEDLHWSLVIICFPEKKDNRSGPIVLHLDSLKLHYSRVVLEDITR
ncbi:unnamed protein product [Linum tenue]|uniref:Ubiquitin-like protease family profile domain-containing protein n=1 Tax=Linum tenue TaxID=586396 RepID=A0AAV0HMD7_9ROSI|nr:unnamed protein product [Linum tenue]